MAGTAVRGLNILVYVGSQVVGGQRGATLNRGSETLDVSNKATEGGWKEFIQGAKEWSIECDGILMASDTGYEALETAYLGGTPVEVKINDGGTWGFKGNAIITDFPVEAPYDDALSYSVTFQGTGALTKATGGE